MTKVAAATAAAPTFYRPLEDGGYTFVDGGVWANNPVMIALVDVLSCFSVARDQIRISESGVWRWSIYCQPHAKVAWWLIRVAGYCLRKYAASVPQCDWPGWPSNWRRKDCPGRIPQGAKTELIWMTGFVRSLSCRTQPKMRLTHWGRGYAQHSFQSQQAHTNQSLRSLRCDDLYAFVQLIRSSIGLHVTHQGFVPFPLLSSVSGACTLNCNLPCYFG